MAKAPELKVYNPEGEYVASCKYLEDAAILAGYNGTGAKVKKGHGGATLWHEGHEDEAALNSFDHASAVMRQRWEANYERQVAKYAPDYITTNETKEETTTMLNWANDKQTIEVEGGIMKRAAKMCIDLGQRYPNMDILMDVDACHSNGCPLNLQGLLEAADADFAHDVFGIRAHINRRTGQLEDCFLPRYAV